MPLAEEDRTVNETDISAVTAALDLSYQILALLADGKFPLIYLIDRYIHFYVAHCNMFSYNY